MAGDQPLTASARTLPGTLLQEIVVDGRHRLVTDQPAGAGGTDRGPSPHELFPAALAACVSVTLATYARTKEWDLGEIAVDVAYDRTSVPRLCRIEIRVDARLDDATRARLEKVAAACPLRRSVEAGFAFEETLVGRAQGEGEVAVA
jgi:putative redox protein